MEMDPNEAVVLKVHLEYIKDKIDGLHSKFDEEKKARDEETRGIDKRVTSIETQLTVAKFVGAPLLVLVNQLLPAWVKQLAGWN